MNEDTTQNQPIDETFEPQDQVGKPVAHGRGSIRSGKNGGNKHNIKVDLQEVENQTISDEVFVNTNPQAQFNNGENVGSQEKLEPQFNVQSGPTSAEDAPDTGLFQDLIKTLETEKAVLRAEAEDWKTKALHANADLQNLSKQHELDLQQSRKSTKKAVANQILHVLTTLHLAFQYTPQTQDENVTNFLNTLQQSFEKSLEDLKQVGIEILLPHPQTPVDAAYMNVLNPGPDMGENPVVKQVVSLGLKIDDVLVQPVSVMV